MALLLLAAFLDFELNISDDLLFTNGIVLGDLTLSEVRPLNLAVVFVAFGLFRTRTGGFAIQSLDFCALSLDIFDSLLNDFGGGRLFSDIDSVLKRGAYGLEGDIGSDGHGEALADRDDVGDIDGIGG